jgi:protein-tyrosine phosphatase
MSEIIPNLWLCSWEDAKKAGKIFIDPFVVNCTKDLGYITNNTVRIPIEDDQFDVRLLNNCIFQICKLINDNLKIGNQVVIHCLAGRQRSATVIICYLMIYCKNIEKPIEFVKQIKNDITYTNFQRTIDYVKKNLI